MQFAHAARLDLDQSRGDGLGGREEFGVGNAHRSAFGLDRRLRQHAMAETLRHRRRARDLVGIERSRKRRGKDVKFARVGHVGEGGSVCAEILGQHIGRHVPDPVAEQESVVLVEIAVVEHQQKLGAVGSETLDRMRDARREIPQVADTDVVDEIAPLRIDRGDARRAVEHVGPFGGFVPMQLAHAAGVEPHVYAGDVLGNAELAHRDLPGPAARLQAHVRVVERKAQIRQRAVVGGRRRDDVRVLAATDRIPRTRVGSALSGPRRLRHRRDGLRLCHRRRRRRERTTGRRDRQHVAARNGIRDRAHRPLLVVVGRAAAAPHGAQPSMA